MKRSGFRVKQRKPLARKRIRSKPKHSGVYSAKFRAWSAISRYVRYIEPRCVTSNHPTTEAGHWQHNSDKPNKQLGGNALWYDIRNIHGQCGFCNRWRNGEGAKYSLFLVQKYGHGVVEELQTLYNTRKMWSIAELDAITEKYTTLLRQEYPAV